MWGWRSQQTTSHVSTLQAPAHPTPKLSLERFLADPSPLPPSPRGPMPSLPSAKSGNKEMWPPPSCQAGLPPVASPTPLTGSGQPSDGMPTLPASHPPAQPSSLAAPQTPPERPEPPTGAAPQPAWGISVREPPKGASRRGSVGMPALPAAWASHLPAAQPAVSPRWMPANPESSPGEGAQPEGGIEGRASTAASGKAAPQLPHGWATAVDAEAVPGEQMAEVQAVELDAAEDESEIPRETLVKKLKAAKKALLWERAVAQRLRQALDVAEAWAPADETAGPEGPDSEVRAMRETMATQHHEIEALRRLLQENQAAEDERKEDAGKQAEELREKLKQTEESLARASKEADEWKEKTASVEESSKAIREAVQQLRDKLAEVGSLQETVSSQQQEIEDLKQEKRAKEDSQKEDAGKQAEELREKLKQTEESLARASKEADEWKEKTASTKESSETIREAVQQLRDKLAQASSESAADAEKSKAETANLQKRLLDSESVVEDLRRKLADSESAGQESSESAAEAEKSKAQCANLQKTLLDSESASEGLRQQLAHWESAAQEEAAKSKAQCTNLQKTLQDSESASEELRRQLAHWQSAAQERSSRDGPLQLRQPKSEEGSEPELGEDGLRLTHVQASTQQLEKLSGDLREHLSRVRESSANQEASVHDFGTSLRSIQAAAADKDKREAEIWARLRHVEAGDSESSELPEALRAKLREVMPDGTSTSAREAFQVHLRHVEAAAAETEAASAKLQVQLRHAEASSAHLEDEVQTLRVKLRHVPQRDDVAVQTDTARQSVQPRKTRKTVLFGEEELRSLPGSVADQPEEEDLDEEKPDTRRAKSRIKSVDFERAGSAVAYVLESEEERSVSGDDAPVGATMSTMSQYSAVSEYYDTYNETSQPCRRRSRGRSTLETYDEEDLWDPEHVAMVTRKLFLKHDKDGTGRIEWESGEAIKFLEEFFWLHKQPPPKIPKPAFHSLYSQVKMDNKAEDVSLQEDATGLNVEEMTAFASKVHQFVYKQLGKEMREQRKSFAISKGDMEVLHRISKQEAEHDPSRRATQRRATLGGAKLQDPAISESADGEVAHRRMTQRRATLGGARLQDAAAGSDDGEAGFQRLAQRRTTRVGVNLREMMAAEEPTRGGAGNDD